MDPEDLFFQMRDMEEAHEKKVEQMQRQLDEARAAAAAAAASGGGGGGGGGKAAGG